MTTGPRQIAAEQQHRQIPTHWQIEFNDWTDRALSSFCGDVRVAAKNRAYAQWEIDYREAFGVLVDYEPGTYIVRRRTLTTDADLQAAIVEAEAEEKAAAARVEAWRAGHTEEAVRARVLAEMNATPTRSCSVCGEDFHEADLPAMAREAPICTPCLGKRFAATLAAGA